MGSRLAPRVMARDWKRLSGRAAWVFEVRASIRSLSSHVLRGDDFALVAEYKNARGSASAVVADLRRSLSRHGRPDMMVLGTETVQVESDLRPRL